MKSWKQVLASPSATILETIKRIDDGALQIALVVDSGGKLVGTVTDGDVRRGMLKGISLDQPASAIMNANPICVAAGSDRQTILALMKQRQLRQIPVVDAAGVLVGLETLDGYLQPAKRENIVVLMAGGEGTRLRPLTQNCPKPMLSVGGRPILETILLNFLEYDFNRFYISVNYMGEVIQEYFGDGSKWGTDIRYVEETERMGTAGALALLPEVPRHPLLVMNGDLLTKANFGQLLEFHAAHRSKATMCVREQDFEVPYGVLTLKDNDIVEIREKPVTRHYVNAGIYVLEPEALHLLPSEGYCDMPVLLESLIRSGGKVAAFPLREYWLDIGQQADFEKGEDEFKGMFQ